jgi:tRNA A-37 threonylcarbamoyl transferase component Bud32
MTETPAPIPEKISRYEIRREIGRGGMATVYLAYDPNFGREVAVKVLPHELLHDPTFRARFQREARTIAALEHPAIVPVYDFGEENGQPFLVMRYLSGGSLIARIRAGPIPPAEAAKILLRIGAALDAAHAKGIVHRDLKPANILFDQYGDAYLGDFGIAQLSGSGGTLTGPMVLGTPAYMSPEQIRGDKKVDGRSDIYALGIVMFEMLTGQAPFTADSPVKMMMMQLSTPPPRISETASQLPPGSNAVLERALAKEPEQRYQKAAEFGQAFQDLTTGKRPVMEEKPAPADRLTAETIELPAESPQALPSAAGPAAPAPERSRRWMLWAGTAAAAAIGVCLCLGAGGGGTLFALSDWGKSLLGFAPPPSAAFTPAPTATAAWTQTETEAPPPTPTRELLTPVPTAAPYVPGQPYLLSDGLAHSESPKVAVDSEGVVHAFWMLNTDALTGKLYHRALAPEGEWSDPECVACTAKEPEYAYEYQVVAGRGGDVCAGFVHLRGADFILSITCYRGSGPGRLQEITLPDDATKFLFAKDLSGGLVNFFLDDNSIQAGGQTLSDGSITIKSPAFTIDAKGNYHLAWIRNSDPPVLVHMFSSDGGKNWSSPSVLLEASDLYDDAFLFSGQKGGVYLALKGQGLRILRWNGAWSEPETLPEDLVTFCYEFVEDAEGAVALVDAAFYSNKSGAWLFRQDSQSTAFSKPQFLFKINDLNIHGLSAAYGPAGTLLALFLEPGESIFEGDMYFLEVEV